MIPRPSAEKIRAAMMALYHTPGEFTEVIDWLEQCAAENAFYARQPNDMADITVAELHPTEDGNK